MTYETPILDGPVAMYETPTLVDLEVEAANEAGGGCSTSGFWGCGALDDAP